MNGKGSRTFVDILCRRADRQPDRIAYRFFPHGIANPVIVSYRELWIEAAALAQRFRIADLQGERILLATTANRHFAVAFYACLLAGAIAVPAPPSSRKRLADRLRLLAADAQAKALVGDEEEVVSHIEMGSVLKFDCRNLLGNVDNPRLAERWVAPCLQEDSLALLQYTSGSTGDPKGVMISHGNLMANSACIQQAMGLHEESKVLTALPLFHDMGLIGGMLQPLYAGCESNPLAPVQFIQHPQWWLQFISQGRITHSGGPNYMFDLATQAISAEQLEAVDLSSWEVAFCGAEPIRASTVSRFSERFEAHGFKPSAFFPCYGMAEATLFITGIKSGEPIKLDNGDGPATVIGCGFPRQETRVEIVDAATGRRVAEGMEGEIWVQGDSVAVGYWNRPDLTRLVFQRFIAEDGEGPFLRTGDLGFLKGGELYITGRLKDILIIRGKKYVPQDIEQEAERSHAAVRPGACVAFAMDRNGAPGLVLAVELRRTWLRRYPEHAGIRRAIGAALFESFQLTAHEIVLLGPYAIPRTSSGKLKRGQCRADYLAGQLASLAEAESLRQERGEAIA
ncbi:MAG: fatty acyl-AMP ligase [Methylococcaceae bacterium]|nr:fatty acyl-AMP ligase [Methylococcaceae bacterium]